MKKIICNLILLISSFSLFSQTKYTHADTLRGGLRPERTAFDVYYYNINLDLDIPNKFISGSVDIYFEEVEDGVSAMQIDLFKNMKVFAIKNEKANDMQFKRDENAIFVERQEPTKKGTKSKITIVYEGNPVVAKDPPWDGGFVWKKDFKNNPWVGVACQQVGASIWWPCKDEQSDEADSVKISVTVPSDLMAICNGNLRNKTILGAKTKYEWFTSYPINNYNVTLNVGKYVNFSEKYKGVEATFDLDYYVMEYNLEKAKLHFKQVIPMLDVFEKRLGPYPFPKDGYALVETPYLGMEHQSAIAYGNNYRKGYDGMERSGMPLGFDFIIVHETGHEWWGNSVGSKDVADMWIHEGFCTYSEALYVEDIYGADTALLYCNAWKMLVQNDVPVQGDFGVNKEGSGDMYNKGGLMLHTLRWLVKDDKKWFATIKGIQKDFRDKTVSGDDLVAYMNKLLGKDYTWFFDQYLKNASPPVLKYTLVQVGNDLEVTMNWEKVSDKFIMPVTIQMSPTKCKTFEITSTPQKILIPKMKSSNFKVDQTHAYFLVR